MKTIPVKIIALVISFLPSISVTNRPFRTKFRPCVDNSDCANLGHTYACFLYMCYPWENSKSSDHPKCDNDNDCWGGEGKCKLDERYQRIQRSIIKYKKVKRVILYFQIIRQDHSSISAQDWQIVEFVFVKLFLAMKIRIVWPANIIWPVVAETTVVLLNIITLGENFHVTPMCHVDSSVLGPIVVIRMVKSSRTL